MYSDTPSATATAPIDGRTSLQMQVKRARNLEPTQHQPAIEGGYPCFLSSLMATNDVEALCSGGAKAH